MARSLHTAAHRQLVTAVIALRKRVGLTQRELAQRLDREQNFVGRMETGQRRIDLVEWILLCRACGVDPAKELNAMVGKLCSLVTAAPAVESREKEVARASAKGDRTAGRKALRRPTA